MKQIIIVADMEGASGIFEENKEALYHEEIYTKSDLWRTYGRECITSDVLAVCEACHEVGVDDIFLYDMHFAGCTESNIIVEKLPENIRLFDVPDRRMFWSRIRGQAALNPYGIITVGQHARYGEPDAYFPHSIQSPPIKRLMINGYNIAEIGMSLMVFERTPYVANVGCQASHKEALEISDSVTCITVKDKAKGYEPTFSETFPTIKEGVLKALIEIDNKTGIDLGDYCMGSIELVDNHYFEDLKNFPWKGKIEKTCAEFETLDIYSAFEIFWRLRALIKKEE